MIQSANIASLANTILDSDVKFIFRKIAKKNDAVVESAIQELISIIPKLDYNTTFIEIVGHCCELFSYLFFDKSEQIRYLSLEMIDLIIKRLNKSITDYITLIFPSLYLYLNDDEPNVSNKAQSILDSLFQTPEKKKSFLARLQSDMCDKLQTILPNLPTPDKATFHPEISPIWGRVASSCIKLISQLLLTIKITKSLSNVIDNFPIFEFLKPTEDNIFYSVQTPNMRISSYSYLIILYKVGHSIIDDTNKVIQLIQYEDHSEAQNILLKLILILLNDGIITTEQIIPIFINSISLYTNPTISNFHEFINKIGNSEFLKQCINKIILINDYKVAETLFNTMYLQKWENGMELTDEFNLHLFEEMISTNPKSEFLHKYPLNIFLKYDNIDDLLIDKDESRCFEFLSNSTQEKLKKWLETRKSVSSNLLINIIKKFDSSLIKEIWNTLENIPINDINSNEYITFVSMFANTNEISNYLKNDNKDKLQMILNQFDRDFSILKCKEVYECCLPLLEENPNNVKYIIKIFPNDEQIKDMINAVIANQDDINNNIFDYFQPDEEFLIDLLCSQTSKSQIVNSKLIPEIIKLIPKLSKEKDPKIFSRNVISFINNNNIDPSLININFEDNVKFYCEYWSYFGFNNINEETFCRFLDSYLINKNQWLPVFLYIHKISYNFLPKKLTNFLSGASDLAKIAHSLKLKYALSCICYFNHLQFNDFDIIDTILVESLSYIKPPLDINDENKTLISIIQMDWNQIKPKAPNFNDNNNIDLILRQTISYLKFYLPTLHIFKPIYPSLKKSLEKADRIIFFYCIRIISIISDSAIDFPSYEILSLLTKYLIKFSPFPLIIENELKSLIKIGKKMNSNEISNYIKNCKNLLNNSNSSFLTHLIISLIKHFNLWNILNEENDLNDISKWNFILNCLIKMPYQKRIEYIQKFKSYVPNILNNISHTSTEFELILTVFPITSFNWYNSLDDNNNNIITILNDMKNNNITNKIFNNIIKNVMKLNNNFISIKYHIQTLNILAVYGEDEFSTHLNLVLKFPNVYPFEEINFICKVGDNFMTESCLKIIKDTFKITQSIESAFIAWKNFIENEEGNPCPICLSYFNSNKMVPNIECETCGMAFHKKCLERWLSNNRRTCPYCNMLFRRKEMLTQVCFKK